MTLDQEKYVLNYLWMILDDAVIFVNEWKIGDV